MPSNLAATIYGVIAVGALLAGESTQLETYGQTAAAVLITLIVYWLAHAYADFTAERLREGERIKLAGLVHMLKQQLPILLGATGPLIALLLAWAVGAGLGSAVSAAIWTAAGMIVLIELVAGVRADLSGRELLLQTVTGALLGLLIIMLKLVLH